MGVEVRWVNPDKTVILFVYVHPWSWDDLHEARSTRDDMLEAVDHAVTVIVDLTASRQLPPNLFAGIRRVWEKKHSKSGSIILVCPNPLLRSACNVLLRLTPGMTSHVRMTYTLSEAYTLLNLPET